MPPAPSLHTLTQCMICCGGVPGNIRRHRRVRGCGGRGGGAAHLQQGRKHCAPRAGGPHTQGQQDLERRGGIQPGAAGTSRQNDTHTSCGRTWGFDANCSSPKSQCVGWGWGCHSTWKCPSREAVGTYVISSKHTTRGFPIWTTIHTTKQERMLVGKKIEGNRNQAVGKERTQHQPHFQAAGPIPASRQWLGGASLRPTPPE